MNQHWRKKTSGFLDHESKRRWAAGAVAGLGAAIAIGAMEFLSAGLNYPLAVIPFATSIVLVIGSPDATPAQPRALIGGHLVATLVGLVVAHATGSQSSVMPWAVPWAAAAAVGLAVLAMFLTRTFHPPAGINPLLVVSANLPWTFIVAPVLAGALLLTAFAFVWHRWVRRQPWPERWL
ncbi:MAG: HPP family protein [Pseudomonadota bacterium]